MTVKVMKKMREDRNREEKGKRRTEIMRED